MADVNAMKAAVDRWAEPKALNGLDIAFPANVVSELMPSMSECGRPPDKWLKFQSDWFYRGIKMAGLVPKDGIDKLVAARHLMAIQGSYEPKHEHKEAAVAYLASRWFDDSSTW